MSELEHATALINGLNLHYVRAGSGPLVVLLHGFPEFWYSWRHQIPALAETHTVVALDQRGYNLSDKPALWQHYTIDLLIDDVRALIEHLGFERATIVGHDWGGAVAWTFAMRYHGYVERLVVMNLPHPKLMIKNLWTNPRQMLRSWYIFIFQIPGLPEWFAKRNNFEFLTKALTSAVQRPGVFSADDIQAYKQAWSQPGALTAMINWYRAYVRQGLKHLNQLSTHAVHAPTLLIWGTADGALGQELTYGTERYATDLRIRYLTDVSHWVQQEAPNEVNAVLIPFVRGEG
ncbi:alpha/beta fold hydrolase [Herpetosiphon llansteffanensis]